MTLLSSLRIVHIAAGSAALLLFWIPLVTKKGGRRHRLTGKLYAYAMGLALVAAWAVCAVRLADEDPDNDARALFLAFIALLSGAAALTGIRIVQTLSRTAPHRNTFDLGVSALLGSGALAMGVLGVAGGGILPIAFALLGLGLSIKQLRFWRSAPAKLEWWYQHMTNMLTSCIATVTAFLVVNVTNLGLDRYALVFWLGPGVVGGFGIATWVRLYRRKFARV